MAVADTAVADTAAARVVLVAGATGLVGREVVAVLLADKSVKKVHTVGRRAPQVAHAKLVHHVVDFAKLPKLPPIDEVYIALGTTAKVAGSQAAFRAIDFDAVLAVAKAGLKAGATRLGVVSAMGANAASAVFYSRVKGQMEQALAELGFKTLVIARPSFIGGDRASLQQPGRSAEGLALKAMSMLSPLIPANYKTVDARQVAHALVHCVKNGADGHTVLLSGELQKY